VGCAGATCHRGPGGSSDHGHWEANGVYQKRRIQYGSGEPGPSADVAGVSPLPAQMCEGASAAHTAQTAALPIELEVRGVGDEHGG
jgi:hypothetical protein